MRVREAGHRRGLVRAVDDMGIRDDWPSPVPYAFGVMGFEIRPYWDRAASAMCGLASGASHYNQKMYFGVERTVMRVQ